jgi:hypothetical protein
MTTDTGAWKTGAKESGRQIAVLRERWPLAFPIRPRDVRPLAVGVAGEIAEAMGWSLPYTRGALPVEDVGTLLQGRRLV